MPQALLVHGFVERAQSLRNVGGGVEAVALFSFNIRTCKCLIVDTGLAQTEPQTGFRV